ncbi:polysaccharide pyruvyl transferase family protein [Metapseudomonas sp. CR1201]
MKIALVTIHNANNYGAIFQAFALQEVLSRYGEVEIVDYENRHISRSFDLVRLKPTLHGALGAGKDIFRIFPRARAIEKFKAFIRTNFKLTARLSQRDLLQNGLKDFDCYVAGSDQIWNPACVSDRREIDPVYFLDFASNGCRKISYASSLGSYVYDENEKIILKNLLSDFSNISVREKSAKEFLDSLLGGGVSHVLDPTLLLSMEEWLVRLDVNNYKAKLPEEKYILLYTVPKVPLIRKAVDLVAKKMGLKIISLDQGLSAGAVVDRQIRDAGPLEFLKLFAGAEFIVTDSFHGVCFSLNFNKPFMAISPGKHSNRLESLLGGVGLTNRLIGSEDELKIFSGFEPDYSYREALQSMREASLNYLKSSLEGMEARSARLNQ